MGTDGWLLLLASAFDRFPIVEADRHAGTRWSHESLAWRAHRVGCVCDHSFVI